MTGVVIAGVLLGLAIAASPLSVCVGAAFIPLFIWAGRGLSPTERRWIWGMLGVAIAVRLVAVGGLYLWHHGDAFVTFPWEPDARFQKMRSLWIRNLWLDIPTPIPYLLRAYDDPEGWTSYLYVMSVLQTMFGAAPYAIYLFNILLFMVAGVALYRLVRESFGGVVAAVGLGLMLFHPTLFLWSVTALKESLYLLLGTASVVALILCLRAGDGRRRLMALAILVICVWTIGTVRRGGDVIAAGGLMVGVAAVIAVRKPPVALAAAGVLIGAAALASTSPAVRARVATELAETARVHIGHLRTEGYSYKLLDPRLYDIVPMSTTYRTMTLPETSRYIVRAVASVVAVPLPWQPRTPRQLLYTPIQMGWYLLLLLALAGVVVGARRDLVLTCVLAGFAAVGIVAVALVSGNVGTLVRHRDGFIPFLAWLSALGGVSIVAKLGSLSRSVAVVPIQSNVPA